MTETVLPPTTQGEIVEPAPKRKTPNGKAVAVAAPSLPAILQGVMSDPTASIERLNAAFDFYQRMETAAARKAFEAAMSDAKTEFDPIVKRHTVNRGTGGTYKHEDLADIEAAVKPSLGKHGLSYRFRGTSSPNEPVAVTCIVTHRDGHFEETTLSAGADNSGGKNSIQGIGSAITYLQRYSLKLALGLAAARDDDGNAASAKPDEFITDAQCSTLLDKIAETESDIARFCKYMGVDGVAKLPASKYQRAIEALNTKARK